MGAVGQWRVELQERPEYRRGWNAFARGWSRQCNPLIGDRRHAWLLGWDDARDDAQPRPGEP